jgi:hypothetical protein
MLDIDRAYRTLRERSGALVDMIIGDVRNELEARRARHNVPASPDPQLGCRPTTTVA